MMPENATRIAAGVDVGTECVKAIVVDGDSRTIGRAVIPTRGYFQACVYEALAAALDDAQRQEEELTALGATGFGADCVVNASFIATESVCHAFGAFQHMGRAMTLVNVGGRDPHVIGVDDTGRPVESRGVRRCALGIGSFLMFTARHLDVNPTRLEELASAAAGVPAAVSSYCSVFSTADVLEQLRSGATREEIALGAMHSIAERIMEIGGFNDPVVISGGVVEYFPGVLKALEKLSGLQIRTVPDSIFTGAYGAALQASRSAAGTIGAATAAALA